MWETEIRNRILNSAAAAERVQSMEHFKNALRGAVVVNCCTAAAVELNNFLT